MRSGAQDPDDGVGPDVTTPVLRSLRATPSTVGGKLMALGRADSCCICATELDAGIRAQWDSTARKVTCLSCVGAATAAAASTEPEGVAEEPPPIDVGAPGASARQEFERRQAK